MATATAGATSRVATVTLWLAAAATIAVRLWMQRHSAHLAIDIRPLRGAGRALLDGDSPFLQRLFVYPPSSLVIAVPYALASWPAAVVGTFAAMAVAMVVAVVLGCRLAGLRPASLRAGAGVALVAASAATVHGILVANVEVLLLPAFCAVLLLAREERWPAAGILLGATLAIKPILLPVLLIFLFARQWRALAWAVGVAVAGSALALAVTPRPGLFFTRTVPYLLSGEDRSPYNSALAGIGDRVGVPSVALLLVQCALLVVGVMAARSLWHSALWPSAGDRLVLSSSALLLTSFITAGWALPHYTILLLPLALVVVRDVTRPTWTLATAGIGYLLVAAPIGALSVASAAARQGIGVAVLWAALMTVAAAAARRGAARSNEAAQR